MEEDVSAVCVREVQKSLDQSVKRLLEQKIEKMGVGHRFRVLDKRIDVGSSGKIIFQGMQTHNADSIKSLEGYDIAWVEEAQSLSQRSLELLRPTIRKPNSELWFTWNPNKDSDPVEFLRKDPPENSIIREVNYKDNPWFPDVLREEMEYDRSRDPDKYRHIWLGRFQMRTNSRVFTNWKVDDFETPVTQQVFMYGADWGFSIDPTVLIRCYIVGNKLFIDREAYRVNCSIENTPALFDQLDAGRARTARIVADSSRPETIDYMQKHGYPNIIPARKGQGSVEEGINFLKNYDIVVHQRCKHTIDELTMYSYKIDRMTDEVLPVLDDKKNHVIDALRYSVETVRRHSRVITLEI